MTWNVPPRAEAPDDVAFVARVLEDVALRICADTARVWVTGFSGGARMTSQRACTLPGRVAAASAVAGIRHPQGDEGDCPAQGRVPLRAIHGAADPLNGWNATHASPPWWTYGVEEAMGRWAQHHGCADTPRRERLAPGATRMRWLGCRGGSAVELVRVDEGGHTWPGTGFVFPPALQLGPTSQAVDATALTLRFFARFGLPLAPPRTPPMQASPAALREGPAAPRTAVP